MSGLEGLGYESLNGVYNSTYYQCFPEYCYPNDSCTWDCEYRKAQYEKYSGGTGDIVAALLFSWIAPTMGIWRVSSSEKTHVKS